MQRFRMARQETFPRKAPKKKRKKLHGAVYALQNRKGEYLFERRSEEGLLGGMLGLPGSPWERDQRAAPPETLAQADWQNAGTVGHIFTHIDLTLDVFVAAAPVGYRRPAAK